MFNSDTQLAKQIYNYLDEVLEPSVELSVRTETTYETYVLVVASKFVRGKGVLAFRKLYTKEELLYSAFHSKSINNLCSTIWVDITNHLGA